MNFSREYFIIDGVQVQQYSLALLLLFIFNNSSSSNSWSEIIDHRKSNNGLEVIFQLVNDYIYKVTLTKSTYINLVSTLILMAPINIIGLILSKICPRNNDLYLDNIVLAKKVRDV